MITKAQWAEIEKKLVWEFSSERFLLGSDEISANREWIKEGQNKLVVYFNGGIKGEWSYKPTSEFYNPLIEKFWRKISKPIWKPQEKAKILKTFGKKEAKVVFPNLDDKFVYYHPYWTTAKNLVRQFQKVQGLELAGNDI
ncbi:MAG: hypothetical protein HQM08_17310 [Candidatus Riflebacteria bacterium]|nr:hypothetical protein [Candidatus Riflebacteria bacterium]